MIVGDREIRRGDMVTIDGSTGEVMLGAVPTVQPRLSGDFERLMQWADEARRMEVRANAETPLDAETARNFGATGIGLCRTEHMFFDPARIQHVREMIFARNAELRRDSLAKLLPAQRGDFEQLFTIMHGLPVTIRLLDPPLHEFLPQTDEDIALFAKAAKLGTEQVRRRLAELHETNPMLGHRGCRLGITYPEIYEMQVRAIMEAAINVMKKTGDTIAPEIMIPLVATEREFEIMKKLADDIAAEVFAEQGTKIDYTVGTMIELPRAALMADRIGIHARFFSFGTNDLTQTTLGLSRDDSASFIAEYKHQGIFAKDPFSSIDVDGVGALVQAACEKGRSVRPDLKLGICGEHGGDPDSIAFFESVGLDYVSCSPYRVPIARLAAAQAAIKAGCKKAAGKGQSAVAKDAKEEKKKAAA
jgi:pyruvate,orthophosphate dikinase